MTTEVRINPEDYLVLICDDEDSIRSMLGEALAGWKFQVATAPSAEAALQYMQAGNIPHIILTDIRMGGMNGIELAAEAKKLSSEIEVVIMTSHGTFETAVQAMRIGVFDYISKPFDDIQDVRTTLVHVAERIYLRFYTEYLLNELQRKNVEVERLASTTNELAQNLDLVKTIEIGTQALSRAFGNCPTVYIQYLPPQKALMATSRVPAGLFGESQVKMLLPQWAITDAATTLKFISSLGSNTEFLMLLEQAWSLNSTELVINDITPGSVPHWQLMPLVTRGIPRGVFACLPKEWNSEESPQLFHRYIQTIATSFENALLHAKVVQTSIRDSLTGLFNVRHFKERFQTELSAAFRISHPMSLLFFDVDHFKKYNDTHGHPAGDVILKMLAELMRESFRGTDVTARYGGEEFVVLLPHTAFVDALEKAESFRQVVEQTKFPKSETQPLGRITISVGVAEFPSHGNDMESVVKAADDALYEAKKKARNMVCAGIPSEGHVPVFVSRPVRTRTNRS